jgi:hypothetical protein
MATDEVTAVPSPADNGNDAALLTGGRRRWGFLIVCLVGVVLLSASIAVGVEAHAQQHRTDAAITATRARLSQSDTLLIEARAQLAVDTAQSDQAGHTLATESAQLATDQAQLANAQAGIYAQGVSISDLDTCLSGVEESLNQLSLGNESGAATTLSGVAATCKDAEPS